jgi:hypothetical protein
VGAPIGNELARDVKRFAGTIAVLVVGLVGEMVPEAGG